MKSILYAGAALMIGASIYGFVDFSKSKDQSDFRNMYVEKQVETGEPAAILPVVKEESGEAATIKEEKEVKGKTVKEPGKKEKVSGKKKNRKIDSEMFSRAPLRSETKNGKVLTSVKSDPVTEN